jgi:DNA-directed RNA polymerase subunit H (RpoH/RPB5)
MATQANIPISEIYKSRQIVLELLKKQGFNVSEYENFSVAEVNAMRQSNQLDMLINKDDSEDKMDDNISKKIYVKYYLGKLIRPTNVHDMIEDLYNVEEILGPNDTLFVIIKDEPNETLINELKHIWDTDKHFVVIESLKRLQFNILEHILVPSHKVLTNKEVKEVMQRYNLTSTTELPDISRFDPVARVIGLKPGSIVEIIRTSKTAIEAPYYRICI